MKNTSKTFLLWAFLIVVAALVYKITEVGFQQSESMTFSQFYQKLKDKSVKEVWFQGEDTIHGIYFDENGQEKSFETTGSTGEETFKLLRENNIIPNYQKVEKNPLIQQIFVSWLPLLLFIGLMFYFVRQIQVGGGRAMSFGKSKARLLNESSKRITFKDVAGVEEAKEELKEIVEFLKDPKKFTKLGGKIPKGVLLVGSPGTGKTLLARAVAGEAGVPFFSISGSDFVEMFVGVGASRVRDLFDQGKKHAPCIIFIDEIDAVGRHRGAGMGGGHDEREQTLNQLLVEMDGFESNEGVILVAATNRPDVLDPALLRPGRFDRRVVVGKPDVKGRLEILNVHTRNVPLEEGVDLESIAKGTPGFSGADLANLCNEAALIAAKRDLKKVTTDCFEAAKDKVMMGSERRSMVMSKEEKYATAVHEAGHALVGFFMPGMDPIHKVSIIPRGMALGVTQSLPEKDEYNISEKKARAILAYAMGGRVAEKMVLQQETSGASNDIERATSLARKMVCEWGMTELGPVAYAGGGGEVFLGRDYGHRQEYSETTGANIDKLVKGIIEQAETKAKDLVGQYQDRLLKLAEALMEYETLDREEIAAILRGEQMPPRKSSPSNPGNESSKVASSTEVKADGIKVLKPVST